MVGFNYQSSAWKENRSLTLGFKLGEQACAEVTGGAVSSCQWSR